MSTRSVIARKTQSGFKGTYHHWDGYPSALGATLFHLHRDHFDGDIEAMLKTLIDDHPAGWSTINGADFSLEPGYGSVGPQCYCHGDRHEKGNSITDKNASACGCEYAYVFDGNGNMEIWSSYCDPRGKFSGQKMIGAFGMGDPKAVWQCWESVDLNGMEPDWKAIQNKERIAQ